jgi:hypothetical protein
MWTLIQTATPIAAAQVYVTVRRRQRLRAIREASEQADRLHRERMRTIYAGMNRQWAEHVREFPLT